MRHLILAALLLVPSLVTAQTSPTQIADDLLAADRAFAAAGAKRELVDALAAMFADTIVMPTPTGIAYGAQKALDAVRANPANKGARMEWAPARVGISGDGRHGFTAGFIVTHRADGTSAPGKYLGYWEKQAAGWRLLVYKRTPAQMPPPAVPMAHIVPAAIVQPATDAAAIARYRDSLADAERAFSRDAQTMGIGPAFVAYGSPDAINLGGPDTPGFVMGNVAIGGNVGTGVDPNTSTVSWGPETTIVAASGDFGVNIGYIVRNKPADDGKTPPPQAFLTIWKRDSPHGKWLYIAE